eukprot:5563477-Prymnesium_polylepis.1
MVPHPRISVFLMPDIDCTSIYTPLATQPWLAGWLTIQAVSSTWPSGYGSVVRIAMELSVVSPLAHIHSILGGMNLQPHSEPPTRTCRCPPS